MALAADMELAKFLKVTKSIVFMHRNKLKVTGRDMPSMTK